MSRDEALSCLCSESATADGEFAQFIPPSKQHFVGVGALRGIRQGVQLIARASNVADLASSVVERDIIRAGHVGLREAAQTLYGFLNVSDPARPIAGFRAWGLGRGSSR